MHAAKRRRLEAAGWHIGTAAEFLGLTQAESDYIEIKLALLYALARVRKQHRWTRAALARKIGVKEFKVRRMEIGDGSIFIDDFVNALLALGATRKDLARIIARS